MPPRGKHYTEIWDAEDGKEPGTTPRFSVPGVRQAAGTSQGGLPLPHMVIPSEFEVVVDEQRGLGNLTERLVAGTVQCEGEQRVGRAEEQWMAEEDPVKVDVVDLEDRVKRELRSVMLLKDHEDVSPTSLHDTALQEYAEPAV
jgi:transcriptional adapter 3